MAIIVCLGGLTAAFWVVCFWVSLLLAVPCVLSLPSRLSLLTHPIPSLCVPSCPFQLLVLLYDCHLLAPPPFICLRSPPLTPNPFHVSQVHALKFVTARHITERDPKGTLCALGGLWDAELDGGDPATCVLIHFVCRPVVCSVSCFHVGYFAVERARSCSCPLRCVHYAAGGVAARTRSAFLFVTAAQMWLERSPFLHLLTIAFACDDCRDESALKRAAIRHLKEQVDIDLSPCTHWYRVYEAHYHRPTAATSSDGATPAAAQGASQLHIFHWTFDNLTWNSLGICSHSYVGINWVCSVF